MTKVLTSTCKDARTYKLTYTHVRCPCGEIVQCLGCTNSESAESNKEAEEREVVDAVCP